MTKKEFQTVVRDTLGQHIADKMELSWRWTTEGQEGGSPWGGEHRPIRNIESEPETEELYKLLEMVAPDISFIQFKRLESTVVTTSRWTSSDYYGNWWAGPEKKVNLNRLYDFLSERELLSNSKEVSTPESAKRKRG